jgi:hypothetical protein
MLLGIWNTCIACCFGAALFSGAVAAESIPAAGTEGAGVKKRERKGPLKNLPSKPQGEHLARIKALGDNSWTDLGSPAPDSKWGKARGRSWSPRAPFAPELRGAFFFGEGPHGMIKPDGHYHDDLWFYDLNQHRWICVYPGIHAKEGYSKIKIGKDGFEVGPDGHPLPIASMVHAYCMVTYDTHRKLFMSMRCSGAYWKEGSFHKGIRGRVKFLKDHKAEIKARAAGRSHSPWIYNTAEGHWEKFRTKNRAADAGFGATLVYVPSVRKVFGYRRNSRPMGWYDPDAREWTHIKPKGNRPPWDMDANSCYDSRRDRIYLGGGIYPARGREVKPGESALWTFDVKTETFARLQPEVNPTPTSYATNRAMMYYDSVNDAVLLFHHRVRRKSREVRRVYAYHPGKNEWEVVADDPPQLKRRGNPTWTGFYDPEFNAHIMHTACDGRANGTMWAYRYKRAPGK